MIAIQHIGGKMNRNNQDLKCSRRTKTLMIIGLILSLNLLLIVCLEYFFKLKNSTTNTLDAIVYISAAYIMFFACYLHCRLIVSDSGRKEF